MAIQLDKEHQEQVYNFLKERLEGSEYGVPTEEERKEIEKKYPTTFKEASK